MKEQPTHSNAPDYINHRGVILEPTTTGRLGLKAAIEQAKAKKLKYRVIKVLHSNLRGTKDQHGNYYVPTPHLYVEQKGVTRKDLEDWDVQTIYELVNYAQESLITGQRAQCMEIISKLSNEQIKAVLQCLTPEQHSPEFQNLIINQIKP